MIHTGAHLSFSKFKSWPSLLRREPNASLTIFVLSAPKNIKSPLIVFVLSIIFFTTSSGKNFNIGDCNPSRPNATSFTFM